METDLLLTDLFSFDIQYRIKVLGLFKRMALEAAMILGEKSSPASLMASQCKDVSRRTRLMQPQVIGVFLSGTKGHFLYAE
jgi:hypothetical protein